MPVNSTTGLGQDRGAVPQPQLRGRLPQPSVAADITAKDRTADVGAPVRPQSPAADRWADRLRALEPVAARIATFADSLPDQYRTAAFTEVLRHVLLKGDVGSVESDQIVTPSSLVRDSLPDDRPTGLSQVQDAPAPIARVAESLRVSPDALARVVAIGTDGSVRVLGRVAGRSVRERQIRLSLIVCYVREHALGELQTDVEMLRAVCIAQGAYDQANFTANFRKDGLLREVAERGAREGRRYVASKTGVEMAASLLRELAES